MQFVTAYGAREMLRTCIRVKLADAGNDLTYVHYGDLPHGFIQMTRHSKRSLESTLEIARLLGEALKAR
jgi:acetyl esterase/lipase